ncbi:MAG: aminotransferase class I/II-fold pyridoxal phosphate-dependent enzyme [Planctomycetes bacterium]|nr:aminotransferase class I/II-fold pyridoxal phosphate-dependent enzyme [Planctomycetota bacterium]
MLNTPAESLNKVIAEHNPALLESFSSRGKALYFPYAGILGQGAEAKDKKFNATIGLATEDDGSPMRLGVLSSLTNLNPKEVFLYAPSFGIPELRKVWLELMRKKNPGLGDKPVSLPVITQALTHGLSLAASLFIEPGDDLIVPDPYWDNYDLLFRDNFQANMVYFNCFTEKGCFNIDGLERELLSRSDKKTVLLLNSPNDPTGYTPSQSEMDSITAAIEKAAKKGGRIVVLIDDAYFGLVYEKGVARESIFSKLSDLHERVLAVKLDGGTKEDYIWGLRIGFITFGVRGGNEKLYKALADKAGGAVRAMISNCSMLSQNMLLKALTHPDYETQKQEKFELLKARYETIVSTLRAHPEYAELFQPLPFNSGYFMCVRPAKGIDAEKVRKILLEKYDTGVINLQGLIRVAFSCLKKDFVPTVFANLAQACAEARSS